MAYPTTLNCYDGNKRVGKCVADVKEAISSK